MDRQNKGFELFFSIRDLFKCKISIRFLSNEIRSDALDIKVFNKKCLPQLNCIISEKSGNLNTELKEKILRTAALYEVQNNKKNSKKYKGKQKY